MTNVAAILAERKTQHGHFPVHADITQRLKETMHDTSNWPMLDSTKREALEMIVHKIGRILAGDPDHLDHWDDIAGYSTLVANELRGKEAE